MNPNQILRLSPLLLGAALAALPIHSAKAVESDLALKLKAGLLTEDARDLTEQSEDTQASFLDLQPQLLTRFSDSFAHFVRLQAFVPSDMVTQTEQDEPVEMEAFAALREFWFEYGGITDYPGEFVRLGLQRLREPGGMWWDRDIETARWVFDTTLFQFEMGGAKAFNAYRSDEVELSQSQRDRAYGFLGVGTQWLPKQFVGVRAAYATDQRELPALGTQMVQNGTATDPLTGNRYWNEPEQRDYGWVGVYLDNKFYQWDRGPGLSYRAEVIGMTGSREFVVTDPATGVVTGTRSQDVTALGGEAGLRARLADAFPLVFGSAYAFGQGGDDANGSRVFRQTGLQSNRSRFTGTRTMVGRFNEAYQADLSNVRVFTAYVALPLSSFDFSLIGSRFDREDAGSPIYTDGVDARPANSSSDLGTGVDAIVTWHFAQVIGQTFVAENDTRSNVRLRASRFAPGEAYAANLGDQNRVVLEGTLWF